MLPQHRDREHITLSHRNYLCHHILKHAFFITFIRGHTWRLALNSEFSDKGGGEGRT